MDMRDSGVALRVRLRITMGKETALEPARTGNRGPLSVLGRWRAAFDDALAFAAPA